MPAAHQQQEIGEGRAVGHPRGERVALQMIDRDEGKPARPGDRLRGQRAHHDATDQARPAGGGDAVEVAEADAGIRHRARDQPVEMVEMAAGGDLGHDAAEGAMLVELREHAVRQDRAAAVGVPAHDGRGRLVAGGLKPQDQHRVRNP